MTLQFRKAQKSDIPEIIKIVKASFPLKHIDMMIWGARNIDAYLDGLINEDDKLLDTGTYVCFNEVLPIAIAQLKRNLSNKQLYLNYICTSKEGRARKLGSNLLLASIKSEGECYENISLDVFEDNLIAFEWYKRLGLKTAGEKIWRLRDIASKGGETGVVSGLPQSLACQERYGFSQISIVTKLRTYLVGLLGDKYLRVTDASILEDEAAINTLALHAPGRTLLIIEPHDAVLSIEQSKSVVAKTIHMSAPVSVVEKNLAKHIGN